MKRLTGFTIVELVIVIAVIAILAAVTVVAYNGVQARADTTARIKETEEWEDLIELYISNYNRLPMTANTQVVNDAAKREATYCLGTGFPDTDFRSPNDPTVQPGGTPGWNSGSCRTLYPSSGDDFIRGHVEPTLNAELAKAGNLPATGPRSLPNGTGSLGPIVSFITTTKMQLGNFIPGTKCPSTYVNSYTYTAEPGKEVALCTKDFEI